MDAAARMAATCRERAAEADELIGAWPELHATTTRGTAARLARRLTVRLEGIDGDITA